MQTESAIAHYKQESPHPDPVSGVRAPMRQIKSYIHQLLKLFLRKIISGHRSDFDWTQFFDRVLFQPAFTHTVGEKRVPAFLAFLGGDGCDLPRSTEQAEFVVAEFINVGQTSTVRKANE